MRKYILLINLLFIISFINANGLTVTPNTININKTVGVQEIVILSIKNTDVLNFYNITFETNDYIKISTISQLNSGQTINITANITANADINQNFRIKGFYQTNIGTSNNSYNINVKYDEGIDNCQLVAIKGDRVTWYNLVSDNIRMINQDTGSEITTIIQNSSYSTLFDIPTTLKYYFMRRGFAFTSICQVDALNDSGFVNNPLLDAILNLNADVVFIPTNIIVTFIESSYNLSYGEETEGILTIKNNGSNIAKNIKLSGEWLTFTPNNFDLNPGITKSISYNILPMITTTNQTNKTYIKNVSVEGNFLTYKQPLQIFINYANVDNGSLDSFTSLDTLLKKFCEKNPEICSPQPKIIYKDASNAEVNVTVSSQQLKEIFALMFEQNDKSDIFKNFIKEEINKLYTDNNITKTEMQELTSMINNIEDNRKESNNVLLISFFIFLVLIIAGLSIYLIIYTKKQKKLEALRRF